VDGCEGQGGIAEQYQCGRILRTDNHLRRDVAEYTEHYRCERNHQGLGNELIERSSQDCVSNRLVECREPLGGVLRYHWRAA
jgi:hypothetical protein